MEKGGTVIEKRRVKRSNPHPPKDCLLPVDAKNYPILKMTGLRGTEKFIVSAHTANDYQRDSNPGWLTLI